MDNDNGLAEGIAGAAEAPDNHRTGGREWKRRRFSLEKGYSYFLGASSVRYFPGGWELPADVSPADCGHMYRIGALLQPGTNMIVKHHKNYDRPATLATLAEQLGVSIDHCKKFISRMLARRIIKKQDGHYYVNPIYFIRGRYLTWGLYHLFQEDLDPFLPDWVIDRFNGDINA